MANLKNLSERIKSVTSIQQVTKAMKMVAAAKVKKAQEKMEISRPYSKSTQELICRILPQISVSDISLVEKNSFIADIFALSTNQHNHFHYGGHLIAVEISTEKMQEFLAKGGKVEKLKDHKPTKEQLRSWKI